MNSHHWARHPTLPQRVLFTALGLFTKDRNDENASAARQRTDDPISNPPSCIDFGRGARGTALDVHDDACHGVDVNDACHGVNDELDTGRDINCDTNESTNADVEFDVGRDDSEPLRRVCTGFLDSDDIYDAAKDFADADLRHGGKPSDGSRDLGKSEDCFAPGYLISVPAPNSGCRGVAGEVGDVGRSSCHVGRSS
jgi:hypothetical protein